MKHKLAGKIAENAMIYGHTIHGTVPNVIVYFFMPEVETVPDFVCTHCHDKQNIANLLRYGENKEIYQKCFMLFREEIK